MLPSALKSSSEINNACRGLILTLILAVSQFCHATLADSTQNTLEQEKKLIYLINNNDASLERRKSAVKQLIAESPDKAWPVLVELLQNQKELKPMRGFASEMLASMNDRHTMDRLEKIAVEKNENSELREIALNSLWKADKERALRAAGLIAQDSYEKEPVRLNAFKYLQNAPNDLDIFKLAQDIFAKKEETFEIRKVSFVIINLNKDQTSLKPFYTKVMIDSEEKSGFRKIAIRKCAALEIDNLETKLLKLIGNQKEKTLVRKIALETLFERKGKLTTLLPELTRTYKSLEKGSIKSEFKKLISAAQSTDVPNQESEVL